MRVPKILLKNLSAKTFVLLAVAVRWPARRARRRPRIGRSGR
jgi:hypothetical protein